MQLGCLAVAVALTVPTLTWAQTRDPVPSWAISPRTGSPADGWPRDPVPHWSIPPRHGQPGQGALPQIGLPLAPIGLSLPPIGLRPADRRDDGARHRRGRSYASWPVMFVMVPQFPAHIDHPPPAPVPAPVEQPLAKGSLVLHVEPAATQVFVDGYYIGAADDFSGQRGGAFLESGAHTVELIAPGFESMAFHVKISANQSIAYRREMTRIQAPPPVSPALKVPTTFYLIPDCYMGNVPPKDAGLPPTCDIARTRTFHN